MTLEAESPFRVRVAYELKSDSPEACAVIAKKVQRWIEDVWMPGNVSWRQAWRTGPEGSRAILEEHLYADSFRSPPSVSSTDVGQLHMVLEGNRRRRTYWRDWLILKLTPDLKAAFPEVGDVLYVRDT